MLRIITLIVIFTIKNNVTINIIIIIAQWSTIKKIKIIIQTANLNNNINNT